MDKLLDEQVDLSSKLKKKFKIELDTLKSESSEFRNHYAGQMSAVIREMERAMNHNIIVCQDTFKNFYDYGNHKSESEFKIV